MNEVDRILCVSMPSLDLQRLPRTYVLPVHLSLDEVRHAEELLINAGVALTDDILEAKLVFGAVTTARRARFELQSRKLKTEPVTQHLHQSTVKSRPEHLDSSLVRKRKRATTEDHELSNTTSETEAGDDTAVKSPSSVSCSKTSTHTATKLPDVAESIEGCEFTIPLGQVKVVKLDWLADSVKTGRRKPVLPYTVYDGRLLDPTVHPRGSAIDVGLSHGVHQLVSGQPQEIRVGQAAPNVIKRDQFEDLPPNSPSVASLQLQGTPRSTWKSKKPGASTQRTSHHSKPPRLLHQTTSEHDEGIHAALPEMPVWVKEKKLYACERITPLESPNDDFIKQLEIVKLARVLTLDEVGVRAYSTSIASLKAYPHKLSNTAEILALPGCDHKIANLFHEWRTSDGRIEAIEELNADPALSCLRMFYGIWGVGATTARDFYYNKGWRDLDDVVMYGWNLLTRAQQIGVKFYEEFDIKIPRSEVEFIASVVTYHAKQIIDDGIECIIVGGYRRGKRESGDVDLILSHREEKATKHLIAPIIKALESSGWITHTLSLHETNSARDQQPLPHRFDGGGPGRGFDTLDKAFMVWQDPTWPSRDDDLLKSPRAKNPNVHRRVDIIISPWRTVGCAIAGWTSGTTFQRDLRRHAKRKKGWKFDSSGVRERATGKWVDLEKWADVQTRATTWQEAERRVFEGLGLKFLEPSERCTG